MEIKTDLSATQPPPPPAGFTCIGGTKVWDTTKKIWVCIKTNNPLTQGGAGGGDLYPPPEDIIAGILAGDIRFSAERAAVMANELRTAATHLRALTLRRVRGKELDHVGATEVSGLFYLGSVFVGIGDVPAGTKARSPRGPAESAAVVAALVDAAGGFARIAAAVESTAFRSRVLGGDLQAR